MTQKLLLAALLLCTLAAHAQTTFSIGPRLGLNVAGTTNYRVTTTTVTWLPAAAPGLLR